MRSCADRYTTLIEHCRDIMRMGAFHVEGNDAALGFGAAKDPQRIHSRHALMRVTAQTKLMRLNSFAANFLHIIYRRSQADCLYDWRCSGFETVRWLVISYIVLGNLVDHLSAAKKWR